MLPSRRTVRALLLAGITATLPPTELSGQGGVADTAVAPQAPAAPTAGPVDSLAAPGAVVVAGADTVLALRTRLGPFSAAERAAAIQRRLDALLQDPFTAVDSVRLVPDTLTGAVDLEASGTVLMTVTAADAEAAGVAVDALAAALATRFGEVLRTRAASLNRRAVILGVLYSLLATAALVLLLRFLNGFFPKYYRLLDRWRTSRLEGGVRLQGLELVSAERVYRVLLAFSKLVRGVVTVLLLYFFVPLVLSFFPWTRGVADQLVGWIVGPFTGAVRAILDYVPKLFSILVILAVTYGVLRLIKLVFDALEHGTIQLAGFYSDWARPTYKIVRFLAIVLAIIVIWPLLPMNDSPQFRGVAAFLGLLISFGSAGAVGNVVGGVVMVYMRPFQVGDHVKIADTVGEVIHKTLLATRVRTLKNVDITIPNAMVLGSHIINYSAAARDHGLILHTTVTLGYDVPWRKVHETLVAAASATPGIWDTPAPRVLQTALNDFYVAYELNAHTDQAHRQPALYSALHQNIQDYCAAAGIEILSPHYGALRDGNASTIPAAHLPHDYHPPAFRVSVADGEPRPRKEKPAVPQRDDRQMNIFG